ncbi:carotenoid biosynthesis protein [Flavobacteriaceae bacterium TP-CH-4]|uniref:Carotenoid biosynthesis protein n=1 Tax=Pelagihabitans pacificus TaxID=2696054 RepID=A0A967E3W2_9FLAO|nr:carotenoid biosynthesis protein [Pelagihabitans pacificus]NHF57767.1 carotenoid biosynthesis protein [Pelagihabitans pacificus]
MVEKLPTYKTPFAIFIIWLFHLSALIGIHLGHQDWFVSKTPINLMIVLILFLWVYPINSLRKYIAFGFFFTVGMFAEWLGVNYGILFGDYAYGANFGPKLDGVPYLIGVNWAVLTFITAIIASKFAKSPLVKITAASLLMLFLDYLMEHTAPVFDFWTFSGGLAGWMNYVCWFALALLFQTVLHFTGIKGNYRFSLHLYLAQLVFFGYLFFYLKP